MANVKLNFYGTESSGTENIELNCVDHNGEIYLSIQDLSCDHQYNYQSIHLDIPTAIKLAKTLRTEINKIKS